MTHQFPADAIAYGRQGVTFGREIVDFTRKIPICVMQHGE
jgi:hypothetical protein